MRRWVKSVATEGVDDTNGLAELDEPKVNNKGEPKVDTRRD